MAYVATIVQPSGKITTREVPTAENGAFQLMMLLNMDGYTGDAEETRGKLVAGEVISHKGFAYSISKAGGSTDLPTIVAGPTIEHGGVDATAEEVDQAVAELREEDPE